MNNDINDSNMVRNKQILILILFLISCSNAASRKFYFWTRMYIINGRLYRLNVITDKDHLLNNSIAKFFDSFKIIDNTIDYNKNIKVDDTLATAPFILDESKSVFKLTEAEKEMFIYSVDGK